MLASFVRSLALSHIFKLSTELPPKHQKQPSFHLSRDNSHILTIQPFTPIPPPTGLRIPGVRREFGMVHDVRAVDGFDGRHPVVEAEGEVLV